MLSPNPVSSSHGALISRTAPFEVINQHKEPLAFCARKIRAPQGAVKMVLMLVKPPLENCAFFEALTRHKEPLAFCARIIRAPQCGAKEDLILVKLAPLRSLPGIKNP
jgi:hypothetical protein